MKTIFHRPYKRLSQLVAEDRAKREKSIWERILRTARERERLYPLT